jgi:hypothetical protein
MAGVEDVGARSEERHEKAAPAVKARWFRMVPGYGAGAEKRSRGTEAFSVARFTTAVSSLESSAVLN